MSLLNEAETIPDSEAAELARISASELSRLLVNAPDADRARVQLDGNDLILPRQAIALLRNILSEMAQGNAVTIVPTHAELTTQEAANILNVSRPHLVKLLEEGIINFSKVGTHRRIQYKDLIAYKQHRFNESKDALDELSQQAQELGMGY